MADRTDPPRPARRILAHLRYYSDSHLIQRDLEDEFRLRLSGGKRSRAVFWYWRQVLSALTANIKRRFSSGGIMLRNYFLTAFRVIRRHRLFSFINIAGLAAGIACCILISIWVREQVSVNGFHEKIDRLYLVRSLFRAEDETNEISGTPPLLGPALASDYPEILEMTRLFNSQPELLLKTDWGVFREKVLFSDNSLFGLFTFPMVKGRGPGESWDASDMVVSERLAAKLFGDREPVGQTVTLDNRIILKVGAVMKNIPSNSTLKFEAWAPFAAFIQYSGLSGFLDNWGNFAFRTYIVLEGSVNPEAFSRKISGRIKQAVPEARVESFVYPFKDYYLKLLEHGQRIRLFSLIALLVLVMACINFANLSTARAERRAREVGIRKTVGARRHTLIGQFLGEAFFFAFLSLVAAMALVVLLLPVFRKLTGLAVGPGDLWVATPWPVILGMTLLAGILSGLYPAFVLSSLKPIRMLKGEDRSRETRAGFRKILVLTQYALSIVFIIGFVVIASQVRFMKTRHPGYTRDAVVYCPIQGEMSRAYPAVKSELMRNPSIERVSVATDLPLNIASIVVGGEWEGAPEHRPSITFCGVDRDFVGMFDLGLVQGRFFGSETPSRSEEIVINEKFAMLLGKKEVVGMRISALDRTFTVIGVVKDFNFRPLDQGLEPLAMFHDDRIMPYRYMFVKAKPDQTAAAIASLKGAEKRFNLDAPLEYRFLDEEAGAQYGDEKRFEGLIGAFMVMAILISSLGLFGLSVFMVERRVREIGIRRILGASAFRVTGLLSMNILKWVLVANLIAWPAAFFFMSRWLEKYAYRIDLAPWIFLLSGGILFLIGVGTVSIQTLRAAFADPVDSIRHE